MNADQLLFSSYTKNYTHPILLVNKQQIIDNYNRFKQAFPRVEVNYAVKANPDVNILATLMQVGSSFEVASQHEIFLLKQADKLNQIQNNQPEFDFSRVVYSNPVRPQRYVETAISHGINWFVVDSTCEIDKVMEIDPKANLYLRLIVPNNNSTFPLTGKFGVDVERATALIEYCAEKLAYLRGVTFHVGSQCPNPQNWLDGIALARQVFKQMRKFGYIETFLDLGGGYPIEHSISVPTIFELAEQINVELDQFPEDVRIIAEPGRYMISSAANMLCQVISRSVRDGKPWFYFDTGVFHGMLEPSTSEEYKPKYITNYGYDDLVESAIAGPTCDSLDIVTRTQMLPRKLQSGDFVVQKSVGSYTSSYGTNFNGFPPPEVVFIDQSY